MRSVTVIGGGVVGLSIAAELLKHKVGVTVVDASSDKQIGCSTANAGWIALAMAVPLPQPGLLGQASKWLLNPGSPLSIKPRLDPALVSWLWTFNSYCRPSAYRKGAAALQALSASVGHLEAWDAMGDEAGIPIRADGVLVLCRSEQHLHEEATALTQSADAEPTRPYLMEQSELRSFEPAVHPSVVGAVWLPTARHVNPTELVSALGQLVEKRGGTIVRGLHVSALRADRERVTGWVTGGTVHSADEVVIAGGIWSAQLARSVGIRLPLEAGKGYALDYSRPPVHVRRPLYLAEARVAVSPFDGSLRLAGTMELSGTNQRLSKRRVAAINASAERYIRGWSVDATYSTRAGLRPLTPDGLPLIGSLGEYSNLYVATGHQMLGVMLAPATAAAMATLICTATNPDYLAAFSPKRFDRGSQ